MIRTIRNYEKYYLEAGLDRLLTFDYKSGFSRLTPEQESKLKEHVSTHHYQDSKALINYVKGHFEVKYSSTGIVDLLHRLGFTYKKPKIIPGKADAEKQLEYLENKLRPLLDKASDASPLYLQMVFIQRTMFTLNMDGYLKGPTKKLGQIQADKD